MMQKKQKHTGKRIQKAVKKANKDWVGAQC